MRRIVMKTFLGRALAVLVTLIGGAAPALAAGPGFAATMEAAGTAARPGAGPCGPHNPFGSATVCVQPYALCISAPCTDTGTVDGGMKIVACACEVIHGASIGKAACADRAPSTTSNGQQTVVSTYSFQQTLPDHRLMTCPPSETAVYADCYNMPCVVDPKDPAKAVCSCPVLPAKSMAFITRGGDCDASACSKTWSGAPAAADEMVNWQLACNLGMPTPPNPYRCGG